MLIGEEEASLSRFEEAVAVLRAGLEVISREDPKQPALPLTVFAMRFWVSAAARTRDAVGGEAAFHNGHRG